MVKRPYWTVRRKRIARLPYARVPVAPVWQVDWVKAGRPCLCRIGGSVPKKGVRALFGSFSSFLVKRWFAFLELRIPDGVTWEAEDVKFGF